MEILLYIIIIMLSFAAGYIYRELKLISDMFALNRNLRALQKTDEALGELGVKNVQHLKHEIIKDTHYFYTVDGDNFAAQGTTLQDAAKHFTLLAGNGEVGRFKHAVDDKDYCFVNSECMEFMEYKSE